MTASRDVSPGRGSVLDDGRWVDEVGLGVIHCEGTPWVERAKGRRLGARGMRCPAAAPKARYVSYDLESSTHKRIHEVERGCGDWDHFTVADTPPSRM
eukprot:3596925-Prymnesium_polylepis.1